MRGQSGVLGLVLLFGVVAVGSLAIAAVGIQAGDGVQNGIDSEQSQQEMGLVSHEIRNSIATGERRSIDGLRGSYEVEEGPTVRIVVNDGAYNESHDIRRMRNGDLVYEGGMVVDDGRVIESPSLVADDDDTSLIIPQISGEQFSGEMTSQRSQMVPIPVRGSVVDIYVESAYYEEWYSQFVGVNAQVTKFDSNETVHVRYDLSSDGLEGIKQSVRLGMSDDSSFGLNEIPRTEIDSYDGGDYERDNAVVETRTGDGNSGGNFELDGDFYYEEGEPNDNPKNFDVSGEIEQREMENITSTKDLLLDAREPNYEASDGDLTGGVYYADDLTLDEDVRVTDEAILIVDGDLVLDEMELEVIGALDIHVHGSLTMTENAEVATENPHEASRISILVDDSITTEGQSDNNNPTGPKFTGLLHATGSSLEVKGAFTVHGAVSLDSLKHDEKPAKHRQFTLHYDERLEGESPYATARIDVERDDPSETFDGKVYEGDSGLEKDPYDQKVLVTGDVTADHEVNNNGEYLLVLGDATFDGGGINSKIYVVGNLTVKGSTNINDEIHVLGDFVHQGSQTLQDVFVGGSASIEGNSNGEIHVSGERVACSGSYYVNGGIYKSDGTSNDGCDNGDIQEGEDPKPPQIPPEYLPQPELITPSKMDGGVHYFAIRIAEVEVE